MPKSIITQTRIADLGEPRIIVIGVGSGYLHLAISSPYTVIFDRPHNCSEKTLISIMEFKKVVIPILCSFINYVSHNSINRLIIGQPTEEVY